uniref:BTB domain-containing protein n=1 Tax=Parastrongyloides trichosuri TaxID=131310 RepID=A0A0N4ZN78_PARTI
MINNSDGKCKNSMLSRYFNEYKNSGEKNCDIKIVLNKKYTIRMHSVVFNCFTNNNANLVNNVFKINNDYIQIETLKKAIEYLYKGEIIIKENELASFYYITQIFNMNTLKKKLNEYILKKSHEIDSQVNSQKLSHIKTNNVVTFKSNSQKVSTNLKDVTNSSKKILPLIIFKNKQNGEESRSSSSRRQPYRCIGGKN